jgi:rRNA maturation endonuclease Nob1
MSKRARKSMRNSLSLKNKTKQRGKMQEKKCNHKRIKKVFSHGRNSRPNLFCKDCGEQVSRCERARARMRNLAKFKKPKIPKPKKRVVRQ